MWINGSRLYQFSKSFRSRICGRLAASGGRWFLPRIRR